MKNYAEREGMSDNKGEQIARRLANTLRFDVHDTKTQQQIVRKALFRVVGRKRGRVILARTPWRVTTGWTQLLFLVKYGHLGNEAESNPARVAEMLGASSVEAVGRMLARM